MKNKVKKFVCTILSFLLILSSAVLPAGSISASADSVNLSAGSSEAAELKSYIDKYESDMKNNPFRTNLANAYKAYMSAREYFDAYTYAQERSSGFIGKMKNSAANLKTAIDAQDTFAFKNSDGSYTVKPFTGKYTPSNGVKFFDGDDVSGSDAYNYYNNVEDAANNILYYPQVNADDDVTKNNDTDYGYPGASNVYHKTNVVQVNTHNQNKWTLGRKANYHSCTRLQLYYPSDIVLLYNGVSNPSFPMMLRLANTHNNSAEFSQLTYLYPTPDSPQERGDQELGIGTLNISTHKDSTEWNIKKSKVAISVNGGVGGSDVSCDYGWQGGAIDGINRPLNYRYVKSQSDVKSQNFSGPGTINYAGAAAGSSTISPINANRRIIATRNEGKWCAAACSSLEYKDNYFQNNADKTYTSYTKINWYMLWYEAWTTQHWEDILFPANSNIVVVNTKPASDTIQSGIINDKSVADTLKYTYLYDNDSSDYIKFLNKIDVISSFDPNGYDYSKTGGGTLDGTANKGVQDCINGMNDLKTNVSDIDWNFTNGSLSTSDGRVKPPTESDKEKESTSTDASASRDGSTLWYDDLRSALSNLPEINMCSDDTLRNDYTSKLETARKFLVQVASDSSSVYYPQRAGSSNLNVSDVASALKTAKEAYIAAPKDLHTYEYAGEDSSQTATFKCEHNDSSSKADMSVYNELDILYSTIDPQAYTDFAQVRKVYDGSGKKESEKYNYQTSSGYSNLSFTQVKSEPALKGGKAQDYVDTGIMKLIEEFNSASSDDRIKTYKVKFYLCIDGENKEYLLSESEHKFGSVPTFDATKDGDEDFELYKNLDAKCYKWSVTASNGKERFFEYGGERFSCPVQEDCTIKAYASRKTDSSQTPVTVKGPTGTVLYKFNASNSDSVSFSYDADNKSLNVKIGDKTYSVAPTASYSVSQQNVKLNSKTYDVSKTFSSVSELLNEIGASSVVISPVSLKTADKKYAIRAFGSSGSIILEKEKNSDGTYVYNVNKGSECSAAEYDTRVTVKYDSLSQGDEFYGIAVNENEINGTSGARYVPISYSNEYIFRMCCGLNFYPLYKDGKNKFYIIDKDGSKAYISSPGDVYYLERHLPFVIDFMDESNLDGKFAFRAAFTTHLPENIKITEHGWVFFRFSGGDSSSFGNIVSGFGIADGDLSVDRGGTLFTSSYNGNDYSGKVYKQNSKTYDVLSHQYSFSSADRQNAYIYARGYVKYTYTYTGENSSLQGKTIEAVSYGPVDNYQNPRQ